MAATQERADLVLGLFDQYYERVYAFLRKSTTPDVAEDLAQEVFLRLLQHPELERLTISISYLLKIAHNLLRRRYARATRLRELLEERSAGQSEFGDDETPATASVLGDAVLETALGLLSKDEQDAIRLIVCEGKSYQHAAEALGVSVTTINNWKHRGIIKLRKLISDPNDPTLVDQAAHSTRASASRFGRESEIETFTTDLRNPRVRPSHGARGAVAGRAAADDAA
ncbi:MAG: RNA polymerase sigma factor [Phycisphaerales bacterium]